MSRNSKNARLVRERNARKRARTVGHTIESSGPNGPSKTTPVHGKAGSAWSSKKVGARPRLWSLTKEVKPNGRAK